MEMKSLIDNALTRTGLPEQAQPAPPETPDDKELMELIEGLKLSIKVFGCGGGGSNTVTRLMNEGVVGAELIAATKFLIQKAREAVDAAEKGGIDVSEARGLLANADGFLAKGKLDDAVEAALRAQVKRLALFHYDQDYSDHDVDQLVRRGRRLLDERGGKGIITLRRTDRTGDVVALKEVIPDDELMVITRGGVIIGGVIAPIFFATAQDSGALPIKADVSKLKMGDVIVVDAKKGEIRSECGRGALQIRQLEY
jgi:aconitase B